MFRNEFNKILHVCPFENWNLAFIKNVKGSRQGNKNYIITKVTMR